MTGKRLFDYIRKQTLPDGTTGRVAFDEMGDRIYAEYQVVNVQSSSKEKRVVVGHYKYSNVSKIKVITKKEPKSDDRKKKFIMLWTFTK